MANRRNLMFLGAGMIVLALLYWSLGVAGVTAALAHLHLAYLMAYLLMACAVRIAYSVRWYVVAATLGDVPHLWRFVCARLAGDAIGTLAPVGRVAGDPVRVAVLCGDGVGGARASAGVMIDRIMETIGNSFAVVAYGVVFAFAHTMGTRGSVGGAVLVALVLPLGALAVLLVQLRRGQRPLTTLAAALGLERHWPRAAGALRSTESDLILFCSDYPGMLALGIVASLLFEGMVIVEYAMLLATFGVDVGLVTLLLVLATTGLVRVLPVPASVGTLEASQVALLAATSGHPELGLIVGTALRLHETLWIAVGLLALSAQSGVLARLRPFGSTSRAAA